MLTPKQQRFVAEYLVDLNATQAAIRAGYSTRTAGSVGSENLKKPEIAAAVQAERAKLASRTGISQDYVLSRLKENAERAMQAVPMMDDDGGSLGIFRYDGAVANRALELIGKHLGLFTEKVEHSGSVISGPVTFVVKAREARA